MQRGYVIIQKKFLAAYSAMEFACWNIWAGALLLLGLFGHQTAIGVAAAPVRATLEIVYLGIFPGALAAVTFAYATARLPAARVMSFMYVVPPLAMLMAWPYLHEIPTLLSLAGDAGDRRRGPGQRARGPLAGPGGQRDRRGSLKNRQKI